MGKLSEKEIDEVERLCKKINCPDISSAEKRDAYEKLDKILDKYFVKLPIQSDQIKGS